MSVFGALMLGWLAFILAFVLVWARFHARARALDGFDEEAYANGLVDRSTTSPVDLTRPRPVSDLAVAVRRSQLDRRRSAPRPRQMATPAPLRLAGRHGNRLHPAGIR